MSPKSKCVFFLKKKLHSEIKLKTNRRFIHNFTLLCNYKLLMLIFFYIILLITYKQKQRKYRVNCSFIYLCVFLYGSKSDSISIYLKALVTCLRLVKKFKSRCPLKFLFQLRCKLI